MKIRIKGNSIRFRLTQAEVLSLRDRGVFEEKTAFNETRFTYRVKVSSEHEHLHASFSDETISLIIPQSVLGNWSENDRVGFYHTQILDNGHKLNLTSKRILSVCTRPSKINRTTIPIRDLKKVFCNRVYNAFFVDNLA